jgi:hypothetical protein
MLTIRLFFLRDPDRETTIEQLSQLRAPAAAAAPRR